MLNERLAAARPIAKSIKGAEDALSDTMRQLGTVLVDIANAKQTKGTRFAIDAGLAAGELVAQAAVSAFRCYKQVVDAHAHLAQDRLNSGLGAVSFGDVLCLISGEGQEAPHALRAVGD